MFEDILPVELEEYILKIYFREIIFPVFLEKVKRLAYKTYLSNAVINKAVNFAIMEKAGQLINKYIIEGSFNFNITEIGILIIYDEYFYDIIDLHKNKIIDIFTFK